MSFTVQHKRSETDSRRPLPSELEYGQVAVNYNNNSPALFFRTSTSVLAKAGPPIISSTTPTISNLVNFQDYSTGEFWINSLNNTMSYMAANGNWISVEGTISLSTLKNVVAASASFTDFQTRIAAL
jgi:hypothetical protein